jgi:DNA-binding winged helix-turn-helix (wHTH) protein
VSYLFDSFRLSVPERELWRGDVLVPVEPKVFDLLAYLVAHRDRAVGRDELIAAVWGRAELADGALAQAVLRLRRVLEDNGNAPRYVRTLPRHGYRWIAPTEEREVAPPDAVAGEDAPAAPAPRRAAAVEAPTRRIGAIVLLLAVFIGALVVAYAVRRQAGVAVSPAELIRSGRVAQARLALEQAQRKTPGSSEVAVQLAEARCALDEACLGALDELLSGDLTAALRTRCLQARAAVGIDTLEFAAARRDLDAAEAQGVDVQAQARTAVLRATLALAERQNDDARRFAQRAKTLAERAGDTNAAGDSAYVLGIAAGREGRGNEALTHLDVAIAAFERTGDFARLARAHAIRSHTLGHLGRFEESLAAAEVAVRAAAQQQVPGAARDALDSLAWAQLQLGRIANARETVHRALDEGTVARHPQQQVQLMSLFGFIEAAGGRFREAIEAWDTALRLDLASPLGAPPVSLHLALVYAALNAGDLARARGEEEQIRALARTTPALEQYADHAQALLAGADGDWKRAATLFRSVWELARRSGTQNQQMLADYADALFHTGDLASVESLLGEASLPAKDGYLYLLLQARYLARQGNLTQAEQAFERGRALMGERYSVQLEAARADIVAAGGQRSAPAAGATAAAPRGPSGSG